MPFDTPLRYPGGKGRLSRFMRQVVDQNNLTDCYVEPYAGGAGIAVSLLLSGIVQRIHINDLNRSVFAFWSEVHQRTEELCRRIKEAELTMEEWHRQRAVQLASDPDPSDLAYSTLYLNRTNRSGILMGGVIGGLGQTGEWKLDARFRKPDLITRIERIGAQANRIEISNLDAAQFLNSKVASLPERTLIYLDPPYYVKGRGLYQNHYGHDDHKNIAAVVAGLKRKWIVSYDNVSEIKSMYAGFRQREFSLHYSAQRRVAGHEVMVFAEGLTVPQDISPSRSPNL